jgi:hypothetical protein
MRGLSIFNYLLGGKLPTPLSISNVKLIDDVPFNANGPLRFIQNCLYGPDPYISHRPPTVLTPLQISSESQKYWDQYISMINIYQFHCISTIATPFMWGCYLLFYCQWAIGSSLLDV